MPIITGDVGSAGRAESQKLKIYHLAWISPERRCWISWDQPPLCHCWSLSPFQSPSWAGTLKAAGQSPKSQPELVEWCHWWPHRTESSWANTAKHSRAQRSGKYSGKHKANDRASEFQPASLLGSSHWGRRVLSHKCFSQPKAFVHQHCSWETFFLLPEVKTLLWVKHSLSHRPFAINIAVVIVILVNLSLLLLYYQKGWVKRE